MALDKISAHPQRVALSNELHARPFPILSAPARAAAVAIERDGDEDTDRAFLIRLLDRYGAAHPAPGADHLTAYLGKVTLKWERHTEFMTFTLYADGVAEVPFNGELFEFFPSEWLSDAPGRLLTSILVRVEREESLASASARLSKVGSDWFYSEAMAAATVLEGDALVAGDFRMDPAGHIRFAVFKLGKTGSDRVGRIVQRLIEIETYKTVAMLTLPIARDVFARLTTLDREMSRVVHDMGDASDDSQRTLDRLLDLSSTVESFSAETAYRFTAAEAYSALVHQRVAVLREERVAGHQLFSEFMMRRFEPAMRTCRSARERLVDISNRAARASRLLSTRVTVATNIQNRELLKKMDRRAALQLRLQETVEGLSVVAISYYAVNLLSTFLSPAAEPLGITAGWLTAGLVPPVVIAVAWAVRRIRRLANERSRPD
ncbi:MAG: DUF3422 domain-containing protein [Pseudomonadota bacterium]